MKALYIAFGVLISGTALAACGAGAGTSSAVIPAAAQIATNAPTQTPTPASAPTVAGATAALTQNLTLGAAPVPVTYGVDASGASGTVTFPAISGGTSVQAISRLQNSLPGGAAPPVARRRIANLNPSAPVVGIAYVIFTPSATVTFAQSPGIAFTFPPGTLSGNVYLVFFDPSQPAQGWNIVGGPVTGSGTTLDIPAQPLAPALTLLANQSYYFGIVETGTPLPTPTPTASANAGPTPTPTPTASPTATPNPTPTPTPLPTGLLYVANSATNTVSVYAPPFGPTSAPIATISAAPGLDALAIDASRNLFAASNSGAVVAEYATPYTAAAAATYANAGPVALLFDGSNDLFVANASANNVQIFQPPSASGHGVTAIRRVLTPGWAFSGPDALALDSSGDLFVANSNGPNVMEFAPPYGSIPSNTLTTYMATPITAILVDSAGNLFVASNGPSGMNDKDVVEFIAPAYTTHTLIQVSSTSGPSAMTMDSHGNLIVAFPGSVNVYAPPFTTTEVPSATITNGISSPVALALDTAGNLYVANATSVTSYAPPFATGESPALTLTNGVSAPTALLVR